jgi:hypothetical protein
MKKLAWIMLALAAHPASGAVEEYTSKSAWMNAAGEYTTLNFAGFPEYTVLTDQYSQVGVTFSDGIDLIVYDSGFLNDGAGLYGAIDSITVQFSQPINLVAVDFPGGVQMILYYQGNLVYESSYFGVQSYGNFAGLTSNEPFDSVVIWDIQSAVYIDDLHFGPPIPAPPVGALMAIGLGLQRGRRRQRG